MSIRFIGILLMLGASCSAVEPVRDVGYAVPFGGVPLFDKGYLFEKTPSWNEFLVYGPDGSRLYGTKLTAPNGVLGVQGSAVSARGAVAVSYAYRDNARVLHGAIAFLDNSGQPTRTVETGLYLANHLCFAPDDSLWAFGEERISPSDVQARNHPVFRRYSRDGAELGRFVNKGALGASSDMGSGLLRLQAAEDRIGALLLFYRRDTEPARQPQWVEVDFDGKVLGKWDIGEPLHLAFTTKGNLYTLDRDAEKQPLLVKLDRPTSSWKPVPNALPDARRYGGFQMMGADGNHVVVRAHNRLLWLAVE